MKALFNMRMAKNEDLGLRAVLTVDIELLILGNPLSVDECISAEQAPVLQLQEPKV